MKTYVVLFFVLLTLTCGCEAPNKPHTSPIPNSPVSATPAPQDTREIFSALLPEINDFHRRIDAPAEDPSQYCYDFSSGKPLPSKEDYELLFSDTEPVWNVRMPVEDACAEVKLLFRYLRDCYGPYEYYGGDPVFEAAEREILAQLETRDNVSVAAYEHILTDQLGFIIDKHFMIGSWTADPDPKIVLFTNSSRAFYRDGEAFYQDAACSIPVTAINGDPPEQYLKPSVEPDGSLAWRLYAFGPQSRPCTVTVTADRDEEISLEQIDAKLPESPESIFDESVRDGVLYLQINQMIFGENAPSFLEPHEETIQEIFESAEKIDQYPAVVLDLRFNQGGNGSLPAQWFAAYTGENLLPNYNELMVKTGEHPDDNYVVTERPPQFVEKDGPLIFVLTSNQTGSAAEAMVDALHNLKNVVFVGTQTGGTLINDANYFITLPHSQLQLQLGSRLRLLDPDYFQEGRGFEPDIYLVGDDFDARFAKFLDKIGATL